MKNRRSCCGICLHKRFFDEAGSNEAAFRYDSGRHDEEAVSSIVETLDDFAVDFPEELSDGSVHRLFTAAAGIGFQILRTLERTEASLIWMWQGWKTSKQPRRTSPLWNRGKFYGFEIRRTHLNAYDKSLQEGGRNMTGQPFADTTFKYLLCFD